jgi:hypothetical protein
VAAGDAVSDRTVFRCDYCRQLVSTDKAVIAYEYIEETADGDYVFLPAVYCSSYCGDRATSRAGASRG